MPVVSPFCDKAILVVDDHDPTRQLLVTYLSRQGADVEGASGGEEALRKMEARKFDLALLDLRMDDIDGLTVLKRCDGPMRPTSFVMMSAEGTIHHAVEAIRLGASDFLVKPFELGLLTEVLSRVIGQSALGPLAKDSRLKWRDEYAPMIVGESEPLLEVLLVMERIAPSDCTALILGESGTGKELVARAMHNASPRSKGPFVPVNCGAIPETLIESELFGHAKGAFSGATATREGRFAAADGGTLFLDEIGEMSLAVQVKFLRVLQEGEYVPVGETRPRKCDVRIVAATNRDLETMASQGQFREDLYYRLSSIPVHLPPLRERLDDLPALVDALTQRLIERHRPPQAIRGITERALDVLRAHAWPGNIRELENTLERMVLLHRGAGLLDVPDIPPKLQSVGRAHAAALPPVPHVELDPGGSATGLSTVQATPADVAAYGAGAGHRGHALTPAPPAGAGGPPQAGAAAPAANLRVASAAAAPAAAASPAADAATRRLAPLEATPEDFVLPPDGIDLRRAVESFEMNLIDQALARTGGNKNQASQLLGMNRTTLVEKLRKRRRQFAVGADD